MEKEKDYFWFIIGGIIVLVIIGVMLFKGREMQSVPTSAYQELKQETEKQMQNTKP
jgi:hypothetical protein